MTAEDKLKEQLIDLKRELNLRHCNLIPQDRQLYLHAQIDALHGVLGYHPEWPKGEFEKLKW